MSDFEIGHDELESCREQGGEGSQPLCLLGTIFRNTPERTRGSDNAQCMCRNVERGCVFACVLGCPGQDKRVTCQRNEQQEVYCLVHNKLTEAVHYEGFVFFLERFIFFAWHFLVECNG